MKRKTIGIFVMMLMISNIFFPISFGFENKLYTENNCILINPEAPEPPSITGPSEGELNVMYTYEIKSEDPQCDNICYKVICSDMPAVYNSEFCASGDILFFNHSWDDYYQKQSPFCIKAKARDCKGYESEWSIFEVGITKNKKFSLISSCYGVLKQLNNIKSNFINKESLKEEDAPIWKVGDSWTYNEKYCGIGSNYAWYHNCTMVCTVIDDTGDSYTLEWVSENDEGSYTIEGYYRLRFTPNTRFIQETKHRKTDLAHESTFWQEKGPVIWLIGNINFPLPAQFSDVSEETYTPADETLPFPITAGSSGTTPGYSFNGHQTVGLYWGIIKIADSDYSGNILACDYNCEMATLTVPAGTYEAYNISREGDFYEDQDYYRSTSTYYVPQVGYVAKQFHHVDYDVSGQYYYEYIGELVSTTYQP